MIPEPMPTMDEDVRDDYREELCHDRRISRGEGWLNPDEDKEEEKEESEREMIKKGMIKQSYEQGTG